MSERLQAAVAPPSPPASSDSTRPAVHVLDPGNFTQAYDLNLAAALMERGWAVEWITSRHESEDLTVPEGLAVRRSFFGLLHREPVRSWLQRPGWGVWRRAAKAVCYPFEMRRLFRQLGCRPPGILHVQWALMPVLDARCWNGLRRRGWCVVHTVHDPEPLAGSLPRLARATTAMLGSADALIVHGSAARRSLIGRRAEPRRVFNMPLSPTVRGDMGRRFSREEARRRLGIPADAAVVLFFGYIKPYKGLDVLLRATAQVRAKVPNVLLVIAGELQDAAATYERTIAEGRLGPSVRWTNGYVPEALAPAYLAASNVVALPYLAASSSAVLVSAQLEARATVASDVGDLSESIDPGRTGLLVPSGDAGALALVLTRLLLDPEGADAMGRTASDDVRDTRGWPLVAERLSEVYEAVWRARDPR